MATEEVVVSVGTYDATVACLTFNTGETGHCLKTRCHWGGHSGSVRTIATDGQWLATGSTDETIRLYNLRDLTEVGTLAYHEGSINWLEFSGGQLYCASDDGTISVWQSKIWTHVCNLTGHKGRVSCVAVHPSGKTALSVGRDKVLRTWDLSIGVAIFRQKLKEVAQCVRWSNSACYYALSYRLKIDIYNLKSGDLVSSCKTIHSVTCFTFLSDEVMALATEEPSLQLKTIKSDERPVNLSGISQRVKDLAVVRERYLLFSASSDGSVQVWKIGQPLTGTACVSVCSVGSRLNCLALGLGNTTSDATASPTDDDGWTHRHHRNLSTTETAVGEGDEKCERNCIAPTEPEAKHHCQHRRPRHRGVRYRCRRTLGLSRLLPFSFNHRNTTSLTSSRIRQHKTFHRRTKAQVGM